MSSSHFSHAHDFNIGNLTISGQMAIASTAIDHLHDHIAADAVHDSDERSSIANCHPETRKAVQEEIHSWITDGDNDAEPKRIMWMTGPAGGGKTAIAGSIAELCEDEGTLAGSFFFSSFAGSETRRTKRCLIATLAYCLLQHDGLQQLRAPILTAIERDRSIFRKSLIAQCKALILKPLRSIRQQLVHSALPKVIVIDGLDELEASDSRQLGSREARLANEAEQVEVLSTLLQAAESPDFPFRILIISRPEPIIRDFFSNRASHLSREIFLDDKYDPDSDIALFLRAKFSEVRRRYKLPILWPGEEVVDKLRENASGQFIYAATVVRFLQTAGMHPQARLDCILEENSAEAPSKASVFSSLDALYTQILRSSPDPVSSTHWLGAIKFLSGNPAVFVRQLLQEYRGQADYLLENLASLVSTPAIDDVQSPFEFYHKSLSDFFCDSKRCGSQLCSAFYDGGNTFLGEHYVEILVAKSPVVPLVESEWPAFLERFIRAFRNYVWSTARQTMVPGKVLGIWEDRISSCDVLWWVRSVDSTSPLLRSCKVTMLSLFDAVHFDVSGLRTSYVLTLVTMLLPLQCTVSDDPQHKECSSLCKRWRSDIFSGCKALGWQVPNAIVLLRQRLWQAWRTETVLDPLEYGGRRMVPIESSFEPPSRLADTSGTSPNFPRPGDDYGDDYESVLRLADTLYPQLPADWRSLYTKEMKEGATEYNALQLEISGIAHELGLEVKREIEDVVASVS